MAADSNAFLTVAQVAKMQLGTEFAYHAKYRISELTEEEKAFNTEMLEKGYPERVIVKHTLKHLQDKFGKENVKKEEGYATVKHDKLAWNKNGSYTNVDNKLTTDHGTWMSFTITTKMTCKEPRALP